MKNIKDIYKKRIAIFLVSLSSIVLGADFIYKTVKDINYYSREKCILYLKLPKSGFLIYEHFIELLFIVTIGIFIAVVLEHYFNRFKRYYPKNAFTAFLYASLIPVCACTTIPMVKSLKEKLSFSTLITFIISAPLLSPYTIVLSFSVLGVRYGILRIICSCILAMLTGLLMDFFYKKEKTKIDLQVYPTRINKQTCPVVKKNLFIQTYDILYSVSPFIIVAAILGIVAELYMPVDYFKHSNLGNGFPGLLIAIIIGIPLYYCHGADVLLLKPVIQHSGLGMGTAIAFSLTSSAICITSAVLLIKFMGKKLTGILFIIIFCLTLLLGVLINLLL